MSVCLAGLVGLPAGRKERHRISNITIYEKKSQHSKLLGWRCRIWVGPNKISPPPLDKASLKVKTFLHIFSLFPTTTGSLNGRTRSSRGQPKKCFFPHHHRKIFITQSVIMFFAFENKKQKVALSGTDTHRSLLLRLLVKFYISDLIWIYITFCCRASRAIELRHVTNQHTCAGSARIYMYGGGEYTTCASALQK